MIFIIKAFLVILIAAIFIRVILSWFPTANNPLVALVYQLTEPILLPLRRVVPRVGMFDFTPTIALIILFLVFGLL